MNKAVFVWATSAWPYLTSAAAVRRSEHVLSLTDGSGVLLLRYSILVAFCWSKYLCFARILLDNLDDGGGGSLWLDEAATEEEEDEGEESVDMLSFEVTEAVPTVGEAEMLSKSSLFSLAALLIGLST